MDKLEKNQIHIWHAHFDGLLKAPKLEDLHPDEIARANKMKFNKHKTKFLTCRSILKKLSSHYLGIPPKDIQLSYTKYGKPFWRHDTDISFNLSHSGNRAIFAFSRNLEIGIDLEAIKTNFEVLDIANNFFSKMECDALNTTPTELRYAAFFRCWTRKESFIKAIGEGLSFPLDSFTVSLKEADTSILLATHYNKNDISNWSMGSFSESNDYIGSWAVKGKIKEVRHFNINLDFVPLL